jgi:uncharacterized repeat protein (TIGR01451 family)
MRDRIAIRAWVARAWVAIRRWVATGGCGAFKRWVGAIVSVFALGWSGAAFAAGGSYATANTGTYAQSLWWLDFTSYNNATAAGGGQAFSFTLPGGAGTLSTTLSLSGNGTLAAVAEPAWTGGGAFGHGAYNGISGDPILYWLDQPGATGTVTLTGLSVKDAAGNTRSFALYAADGENTNSPETIVYTSTAAWKLIDTVNYYASYNGGVPALAGVGTTTVTESAPTGTDSNYNASVVFGTLNPTQASFALANNEAVGVAVSLPSVTFTVSVASRISASDQFTASLGYTSPAASLKTASTSSTASSATTGLVQVIGTNSITLSAAMTSGSPSSLAYYTGTIACTNSGPGAAGYGTSTVLPSGAGTSFTLTPQTGDTIACTLTLTPQGETVAGTVYADSNHNQTLDAGETGSGITGLYVKLAPYSGGACQTPATAAAPVTAATGVYSFATVISVTAGSYCLTLTNNSTLSNTTPYLPPGWLGTEAPSGVRQVTIGAGAPPVQNFGLYNGSALSAVVFADTGAGGGTANDGVQNGSEAGQNGVTVTASVGGNAIASASTGSAGLATLWLPASTSGSVTLTPTNPSGDLSTGGSAGTTGGSYTRPSVTFTYAAGVTYTGIAFGLIPANTLAPNGAQSAQPGTTLYYPHTFSAGSAGQVTFSMSAVSSPTLPGWTQVLYLDAACSGQSAGSDTVISTPISVTANQQVCILVKQFVPAGAPANAQNKVSVSASLAYSGSAAPPASVLTATDTTTVTTAADAQLVKRVQNVTLAGAYTTANTALPGNTLQYQLSVSNQGSAAVSTVVVNDSTPVFTTFVSAACPATLPSGLTSCAVTLQPAVGGTGALQWTFQGSLASGAQTSVTYQVVITQ